jgi:hypothetical protein
MSLSWNVRECRDHTELLREDGGATPMTEAVVFACMAVGIGHINDKTWEDFAARVKLLGVGWEALTPGVIKRYVGLRTNVTYETPTRWLKRTYENRLNDVRYIMRNAQ